jgi:transketolase
MRNAFLNTLLEAAENDSCVALLVAEVGFSVVEPFEKKFPDRFYNIGIAEQNLVLVAAGMAIAGMRPVAYSMSAFLPSRAFELIKVSVCYQNLPVTIVSVGSGLSQCDMGPAHTAQEESALMRALPNMTVIFPSDSVDLNGALSYALTANHPVYIAFPKSPPYQLPDHVFNVGKMPCYRIGDDGAIFAVGMSVVNALEASKILESRGLSLSVFGLHTVKPLDRDAILKACAAENIFVVDEHQGWAGTAGDIATIILEAGASPKLFRNISIPDKFPDKVAKYPELIEQFGLSAACITARILDSYESDNS